MSYLADCELLKDKLARGSWRKGVCKAWFSQKSSSSNFRVPGGHVTGYFLVSILKTLGTEAAFCPPTTHCSLTIFPVLWGFLPKKEFSLEYVNVKLTKPVENFYEFI